MADHKHWKRTLKRNTLNILLVVLVLALLAGVAAAVWTILPLFQRNHTEQPPQEEAEPTLEELLRPDETIPDPEDAEPGELPVTGEQTKPQAPRHTLGGVAVYYEDGALTDTISQAHGIALTLPGGEALPRIDLQGISGSWGSLSDSERETLAVGVVQSYYVDGPAAEQVEVRADSAVERGYLVTVPETEDAPAVTARVKFLQVGQTLWIVSLLETTEAAGNELLQSVYETAEVA